MEGVKHGIGFQLGRVIWGVGKWLIIVTIGLMALKCSGGQSDYERFMDKHQKDLKQLQQYHQQQHQQNKH